MQNFNLLTFEINDSYETNKYKNNVSSLYYFTDSFSGTGCEGLLDKQPLTSISDANFWTGEEDALLALVGCYRFPSGWTHEDFAHPQGLIYLDLAGGNGVEKENFTTLGMATSNTVATSGNILGYWSNAYSQIAHYNTFLDKIVDCPMNEGKKSCGLQKLNAYGHITCFILLSIGKMCQCP